MPRHVRPGKRISARPAEMTEPIEKLEHAARNQLRGDSFVHDVGQEDEQDRQTCEEIVEPFGCVF